MHTNHFDTGNNIKMKNFKNIIGNKILQILIFELTYKI